MAASIILYSGYWYIKAQQENQQNQEHQGIPVQGIPVRRAIPPVDFMDFPEYSHTVLPIP